MNIFSSTKAVVGSGSQHDCATVRIAAKYCRHVCGVSAILFTLLAPVAPLHAQQKIPNGIFLTGVNIAGAEFNGRKVPGIPGTDYFYPARATIDYMAAKGMNVIRVPFLWERMQPQLSGPLDAAELKRLEDVVNYAGAKGLVVILDVHNYGYYRQQVIGSPDVPVNALASLWGQLAKHFKDNPKAAFGLMNEPKGIPAETWLAAANAAIAEIRKNGAKNIVFVPGNNWTGAHSWFSRSNGSPNAEVMTKIVDPGKNFIYEVHQYLDSNYSGTHPECRNETVGVSTLTAFTDWLRQHKARGFLGEFGAGANPTCLAALDGMLKFMDDNRDVWTGWAYWAAGAWPPSYFTSVQPVNGADRPQMAVLLKHMAHGGGTSGSGAGR